MKLVRTCRANGCLNSSNGLEGSDYCWTHTATPEEIGDLRRRNAELNRLLGSVELEAHNAWKAVADYRERYDRLDRELGFAPEPLRSLVV
jgi:hypothetical protein